MNDFYCMKCNRKLPDYFIISELNKINDDEYKIIEKKINTFVLRNQGIMAICPFCKDETYPVLSDELNKIGKKNEEIELNIFNKWKKTNREITG